MELVDVVDSKSTAGDSVPVRVRSPAPSKTLSCQSREGFTMISVPVRTGDIPCGYDICSADDIRFAYDGTDIISYLHEMEIYHTAQAVYHIALAIYH